MFTDDVIPKPVSAEWLPYWKLNPKPGDVLLVRAEAYDGTIQTSHCVVRADGLLFSSPDAPAISPAKYPHHEFFNVTEHGEPK